jgi:hypothetical protein
LLRYGQEHYRQQSEETSTLLSDLLQCYDEDKEMSEKLKEYAQESRKRMLEKMSPEERLKGLSPEEVIRGLSPETLETIRKQLQDNDPKSGDKLKQ